LRAVTVTAGAVGTTAANNICLSQTPSGAGNLTLNGSLVTGGVGVFPTLQRVKITTTDTTHVFTLTGTSNTGTLVTETLQNTGSSITSALDYLTVTSIAINGAATGAVTVGNGGSPLAATPWVRLDEYSPGTVSIQVNVTGTVNFTVQSSNDGQMDSPTGLAQNYVWITTNDANAVNATASLQTNFLFVPIWGRVLLNSGSGSIKAIFVQSGMAPY
jgi:hypothetical protein